MVSFWNWKAAFGIHWKEWRPTATHFGFYRTFCFIFKHSQALASFLISNKTSALPYSFFTHPQQTVQGQTLKNFAIFLPHILWNLQWWITICFHTSLLHSFLHRGKTFQAIFRTIKSPCDSLMWPESRNLDSTPGQVGFVSSEIIFFLILVSWFQHHPNFTKTC